MKRNYILLRLFLLILILLGNQTFYSQNISWQQTNGPFGGIVQCVAVNQNGILFAVSGLKLYKSSDNGTSWIYTGLSLDYVSNSILISNNGNIFVVDGPSIHKSIDNGSTWSTTQLSSSGYTSKVSKNNAGELFIAIDNMLYFSSDDGETWSPTISSLPITNIIGISTTSESNYYITTNIGIFRSSDKGVSWTNVTNNLEAKPYFGVVTKNGNVSVGGRGVIYTSTNNGSTWSQTFSGSTDIIGNFAIDSSGNVWGAGMNILIKSKDDGSTWTIKQNLFSSNLIYNTLDILADGKIFAGGLDGVLLFQNDASNLVHLKNGLVGSETSGLAIAKDGKVFVQSEYEIYATNDKGNNWNPTNAKSVFYYGYNPKLYLTSDENGYIYFGDNNGIGISKDCGVTWTKRVIAGTNKIYCIAFGKNGMQFAIDQNKIFRSTNNGTNWQTIKVYSESWANYKIIVDKNGYVYHLRNDGIYKSTDNGENWLKVTPNSYTNFLDFLISRKGYVIATCGNNILVSSNSGSDWISKTVTPYYDSGTTLLLEAADGRVLANTSYGLYYSYDDCNTWNYVDNWDTRGFGIAHYMLIDKEGYLYSGTQGKGVYRTTTSVVKIFPSLVRTCRPRDQKAIISWSKNTSANFGNYKIYGSTNHYPSEVVGVTNGGVNDTTIVISGLANDVPYYIVVSAVDNEGNESFSEEVSVIPIAPPSKPNLHFPENNMVNLSPNCLLRWNKAQRAERYSLQIAADSIFTEIIVNDTLLTDTTYNVNSLVYDSKYYWRIKACNISGESNWSDTWSFMTVIAPPEKPSLLQPNNNEINLQVNVTLKWNKLSAAEKYHLQIAGTTDFSNKVVNDSLLTDTLKQVSLENNRTYYWRVRANNIGGNSSWSEVWSFKTIVALPGIPALVSPVNESKNQFKDVKVVWNAAPYAETYRFQLSEEQGFINPLINDSTITNTSKDLSGLKTGMKYYWRVKAMNIAGMSDYSSAWNFTTLLPTPENLNAVSTELRKVSLTWNDKSDNEAGFILERNTEGEAGYRVIDTIKTDAVSCIDSTVALATKYKYRIKSYTVHAISAYSNDASVTTLTSVDELKSIPTEYLLTQNYPNPFNPVTNINYQIPKEGFVTLRVYDILGREIVTLVNEYKPIGKYTVEFNANNLVSGTYIYELKVNDYKSIKKLTLLK